MNWTEADLKSHYDRMGGRVEVPAVKPTAPPRNRMNKWEAEYAGNLESQKTVGLIRWWGFEAYSLRLAAGARFTPDFAVLKDGRLEFHECKGFFREAALVRIKVAAELYPWHKFTVVRKKKVSEGGGWEIIREFGDTSAG